MPAREPPTQSGGTGIAQAPTIPEPTQTIPQAYAREYQAIPTIPEPTQTTPITSVWEHRTGHTIPILTEITVGAIKQQTYENAKRSPAPTRGFSNETVREEENVSFNG